MDLAAAAAVWEAAPRNNICYAATGTELCLGKTHRDLRRYFLESSYEPFHARPEKGWSLLSPPRMLFFPLSRSRALPPVVEGLAGADFELHALFSPTVGPADALTAANRLLGVLRRDPNAFAAKLPTY
jgi:hypothetical protein